MDLSTLKTNRGAVVSIHRGKITTTNIWWENGWYVITDSVVLQKLDEIIIDEKSSRPDDARQKAIDLRSVHVNPNQIGYPYRRSGSTQTVKPTVNNQPTQQDAPKQDAPKQDAPQQTPEEQKAQQDAELQKELTNLKRSISTRLVKFFSEFKFSPSPRFVNTLVFNSTTYASAQRYVGGYFKLIGNMYTNDVCNKMQSDEWKNIIQDIQKISPYVTNKVNHRLIILYGPAGSGKTTTAKITYPNAKIIGCSGTMDPTDLMKTFTFNDANGNPQFKPSEFQNAMVNGEPIILDEGGLLPPDTWRFSQSFLDNKDEIYFEGNLIKIHPDFKVIVTMNDVVNAQDVILPEPIVDRAEALTYYDTSADLLAKYAF